MIGSVYKIITPNNEVYIGSTIKSDLRIRELEHIKFYKLWKKGTDRKHATIYDYYDKYGIENCRMELIKEYQVVDRKHLMIYEQLWLNKTPNNINKYKIIWTPKWLFEKARYRKRVQSTENYHQKWYEDRKQKNPGYYKVKVLCECGVEVSKNHLSRHKKTEKHLEAIQIG